MGLEPEFDFARFSYADQNAEHLTRLKFQRLAQQIDNASDLSNQEFDALLDQYTDMEKRLNAFLCKRLVSVPRDWLVTDAPDTLDWTDPESLDYVRGDCMRTLWRAFNEARSPESVSGN